MNQADIDAIGALVVIVDEASGRVVRWNRACEELTGASLADAQDKYLPRDDVPWVTRGGDRRIIAWTRREIAGCEGKGTLSVYTGTDVTGMQAAEQRLRGFLESGPDAVLAVDRAHRVVVANQRAEALLGYSRAELMGMRIDELVPGGVRGAHSDFVDRYLEAPYPRPMGSGLDLAAKRKDGTEVPVDITLSPVVLGNDLVVIAVLRDLTETRRTLAALRDRDLRLRAVFDNTFQFLGLLAPDGTLLEANQTALAFIGSARAEVIGKRFWETPWWTVGDSDLPDRVRRAVAAAAHGAFVRMEVEHRAPSGEVVVMDFSLTPVVNDRGEVAYLIPEGRDITERKELERLREDYLSFISHDLKNPLGTIALRAELLRRSLRARGLEMELVETELIAQSAERIASMIRELLDVAGLESGQVELQATRVDLAKLAVETLRRAVAPLDLARFRLDAPEGAWVEVEPHRIERVVVNFLSNALKYSEPETPIILSVFEREGRAIVAVHNEGRGLEPAEATRVFDKYRRGHHLRGVEGIGLGLYISRLIIEAHGGRVWVESGRDAGATFAFALDRVPAPEAGAHLATPRETAPHRVLAVDDEPHALAALAELLRDEGFVVETAASGLEALDKLESFGPDVVLADIEMPGMNGIELVRVALAHLPGLRAIFMSGRSSADERIAAMGASSIEKPLDIDALVRLLRSAGPR